MTLFYYPPDIDLDYFLHFFRSERWTDSTRLECCRKTSSLSIPLVSQPHTSTLTLLVHLLFNPTLHPSPSLSHSLRWCQPLSLNLFLATCHSVQLFFTFYDILGFIFAKMFIAFSFRSHIHEEIKIAFSFSSSRARATPLTFNDPVSSPFFDRVRANADIRYLWTL